MGDQKKKKRKSLKVEACSGRSSPPALCGPSSGLHCCRRYWVRRMSKELLLHLSSCKLCLDNYLHLHPCHHWHLLVGFPNNNTDMHGMLRSSSSSINGSHLPHNGHWQRNHQHHHSTWMKKKKKPALFIEFTKVNHLLKP